jgi:hypothetical protein
MSSGGLSKARLGRMHDVMAGHVERGVPGLITLVSRRGEVHVDAIGMKAAGGPEAIRNGPIRRDTICRISSMTRASTAASASCPGLRSRHRSADTRTEGSVRSGRWLL